MNASKDKGSAWETNCCVELIRNGWVQAEPRRMGGSNDRGDVAGIPGVVIECKNEKRMDVPGWLREADVEGVNADADITLVWAHLVGKGRAADGVIHMRPAMLFKLLKLAGW